jgi:hypothetical protein
VTVSALTSIPVDETAYGTVETVTEPVAQKEHVVLRNDAEVAVRSYFSDIPVMIEVARCESTFRHTLSDGSVLRGKVDSRDVGVMQINTGYHGTTAQKLGLDLLTIQDNMAYARYLYEKQGTQPWSASAKCWNRSVARI